MRADTLRTLLLILTLTAASLLLADPALVQAEPRLAIEPDTVTVGDPVRLTLTLPDADPSRILWPELSGKLGDLTLLRIDTLTGKAARAFGGPTLALTLAAFDTGAASTGPIEFNGPDGAISLPGATVTVRTVLADSSSELRPFKAPEELPITLLDVLGWIWPYLLGAALLALAWLLLRRWLARRRQREEEPETVTVPPYDEAVMALARLKQDNPLKQGDQKGYVSALTTIVKRLLQRVHGDPVLEMTTGELRAWAHPERIRCERVEMLRLIELADTIKFAKGQIAPEQAEALYAVAEQIVLAYRPRPEGQGDGQGAGRSAAQDAARSAPEASAWRSNVRGAAADDEGDRR